MRELTVRFQLAAAVVATGADEHNPYEDVSVEDDQLASVACLARAAPRRSLALLRQVFGDAVPTLLPALSAGPCTASITLMEQMYWLFALSGHIVADDFQGVSADAVPSGDKPSLPHVISHPGIAVSSLVF
jgi:hypothetical protein